MVLISILIYEVEVEQSSGRVWPLAGHFQFLVVSVV